MKESYEVMMDKLGKERGKPFIANLKKQKPKFDKLSYPEKLKFWEDNDLELTVTTYHLIDGEKSNEPQNHITIFPNNKEEEQLYFDWYFAHLKIFFPLQYDFDKMRENYYVKINENPQPIYYTEGELKKYQTQFDNYFTTDKTGLARRSANSFVKGFNSVAKKEMLDFVSSDFTSQNSTLLADGIIAAHFIGFLREQLIILEEEQRNPKPKGKNQIEKLKLPKRTDYQKPTLENQKQISLLAYYLREQKLIQPSISNTLLAQCFGTMNDYSPSQIQKLFDGVMDASEISQNENDFQMLISELKRLAVHIEQQMNEFKNDKVLKR